MMSCYRTSDAIAAVRDQCSIYTGPFTSLGETSEFHTIIYANTGHRTTIMRGVTTILPPRFLANFSDSLSAEPLHKMHLRRCRSLKQLLPCRIRAVCSKSADHIVICLDFIIPAPLADFWICLAGVCIRIAMIHVFFPADGLFCRY